MMFKEVKEEGLEKGMTLILKLMVSLYIINFQMQILPQIAYIYIMYLRSKYEICGKLIYNLSSKRNIAGS